MDDSYFTVGRIAVLFSLSESVLREVPEISICYEAYDV